jgi:hypothetical protein
VRVCYTEVMSPSELDAAELESKKGQNCDSLGGANMLDCDKGESCGRTSSSILVRVVHAFK